MSPQWTNMRKYICLGSMINKKGLKSLRVWCLYISKLGVGRINVKRLNVERLNKYGPCAHRLRKDTLSRLLCPHGLGEGISNKVLCLNLCGLCKMLNLEWKDIELRSISLAILWVHFSLHSSNPIPFLCTRGGWTTSLGLVGIVFLT